MNITPTIDRIILDIKRLQIEMGTPNLPFYITSDADWTKCAREHVGGPWLGKMMICGVPLLKASELGSERSNGATR